MFLINVTSSTGSPWVEIYSVGQGFIRAISIKLTDGTQMYEPPEATRHYNSLKLSIFLSVRANLLCTLQCETPYSYKKYDPSDKFSTHFVALGLLSNLAGDLINEQII